MKFFGHHHIIGEDGSPYMTRYWFGRLRLHIFYRGDHDADPHDHPWNFWTFPLTSYVEEVTTRHEQTFNHGSGAIIRPPIVTHETRCQIVRAFKLHYRPATHTHRVIGPYDPSGETDFGCMPVIRTRPGRIITIVWRGKGERRWGFLKHRDGAWCWEYWRSYINGGRNTACAPEDES